MHIPVYQHTTFKQSLWHKDSQHLLNFRCCSEWNGRQTFLTSQKSL